MIGRSSAITDPREYRRGMVLGLTLAETLILLVFLLLFAAAAILVRDQREIERLTAQLQRSDSALAELRPLLDRLGQKRLASEELVALLERGRDAEALRNSLEVAQGALAAAERENERARQVAAAQSAQIDRLKSAQQGAVEKAVILDVLVETLRSLTDETVISPVDALNAHVTRLRDLEATNRVLEGQKAQIQGELNKLRPGRGPFLPYCWPTPSGRAEVMFRVQMHDDGFTFSDTQPRPRGNDVAWSLVENLRRGSVLSRNEVTTALDSLIRKSRSDGCRYAIQTIDETGRTNKLGYKAARAFLNGMFSVAEIRPR